MREAFVGTSLPRLEDEELLRGEAMFVGDVRLPDALHAAFVRSPVPHGRIRGVDLSAVRTLHGVVDAFSAADLGVAADPLPAVLHLPPELEEFRERALPTDRVRYVGEAVAVVVAETRALAEDAAAAVELDLDPLPVVATAEDAVAPGATQLFDGVSNDIWTVRKATGVVDDVLRDAEVVVEGTFRVHRRSGMPLETRGLVARPDPDGGLTLWGVTKMPHAVRAGVARLLGLPQGSVRVVPVAVGGGFGVRGEFYREDVLVPIAALRCRRPVSWIEDRREHLLATNHAGDSAWWVRAGATREGRIVGLQGRVTLDIGAYVRTLGTVVPELMAVNLLGPYAIDAFGCEVRCVVTNKMGIGTVRGPGRSEAGFARERLIDLLAARLELEPLEVRERNLVEPDRPHPTGLEIFGSQVIYDAGDIRESLRIAAQTIDVPASRMREGSVRVGTAAVPFVESTGLGPFEMARVVLGDDARLRVYVGTTSMGQGHRTTFAQIAADATGIPVDHVDVHEGNPDMLPAAIGTFASRSTVTAGSAIWEAGTELRRRLECLDVGDLPLAEIPDAARERKISLDVTARFDVPQPTYASGAHAAEVEVDTELGMMRVRRYVVVADVGTIVNPSVVLGQIQGAAAQGIGGALLEEIAYTPDGQPAAGSFMDYLLPTALDVPEVEVILRDGSPSDRNPLGVRGAGEVGTIAVAATLAAAVQNALGPNARWLEELPLRPERLVDR